MKRIRILAVLVLMVFLMTGCDALIELPEELKEEEVQKTDLKKTEFEGPDEKAKAPRGAKVALVPAQASLSGCIVPCEAIQEVGERYDWDIQMFDGKGTPDEENTAIMNAIAWKADIIITISLDARSVQQGIQAANTAGIPIVSGSNGTDDPNPRLNLEKEGLVDFLYDVGPDYRALGTAMAEWMESHRELSGHVVIYSCPGSYSVEYFEDGLLAGLEQTELSVDGQLQKFTFEQMGDELNRMVIGYVTANPETEFIFLPFEPAAVSVAEALETAGIQDVKVCGVLGNQEMISLIRQGTVAACTAAYDNVYLGYATADQAIRVLNGQELAAPRGENLPYQIIDIQSLPKEGEAWAPNMNYKERYYELWD